MVVQSSNSNSTGKKFQTNDDEISVCRTFRLRDPDIAADRANPFLYSTISKDQLSRSRKFGGALQDQFLGVFSTSIVDLPANLVLARLQNGDGREPGFVME